MCLALLKMTLGHDETAILKQKPGLQTFGSCFIKNTAKIGRGSWSVCPLASTYLSMPRELVPSSLTIGRILDLDRLSNYWIKILKISTDPYAHPVPDVPDPQPCNDNLSHTSYRTAHESRPPGSGSTGLSLDTHQHQTAPHPAMPRPPLKRERTRSPQ